MVTENRVLAITRLESKAQLLAHFCAATWPIHTGFQLGDLLFVVSRQTTPGAPEFTVIRNGDQIKTLSLGCLSRQQVSAIVDELLVEGGVWAGDVT